jgi:hypothetical protein
MLVTSFDLLVFGDLNCGDYDTEKDQVPEKRKTERRPHAISGR